MISHRVVLIACLIGAIQGGIISGRLSHYLQVKGSLSFLVFLFSLLLGVIFGFLEVGLILEVKKRVLMIQNHSRNPKK